MEDFLNINPNDVPLDFTGPEWALIITGAVLLRLIPLLITLSALFKLRRFPTLRSLHTILLISVLLVIALGAIDTLAPGLISTQIRASGFWSFLWIFAGAWLGVAWTRSAIKTGLRPRTLDIATLVCAATLALLASGLILPNLGAL